MRAHLKREMGRLHGKGKILPDWGRSHGFRKCKIATEHRYHRFDFKECQGTAWTHPRSASKRQHGVGRVSRAGFHRRRQPALWLKLPGGGKGGLLHPPVPGQKKDGGAGWQMDTAYVHRMRGFKTQQGGHRLEPHCLSCAIASI